MTTRHAKRLILNADDLGLTAGVNRAVFELEAAHKLTSATLMAGADECAAAAHEALASHPHLGIGCHIVLVDGKPILPPEKIPTLIDPVTGEFRRTLGSFVKALLSGRIKPAEIEAEAMAQIHRLVALGIRPTHIDTHKHTHLFPAVLEPVLRAAHRWGIRAVRNPFEPTWAVKATEGAPFTRRVQVRMLASMHHVFRRLVRKYGFAAPDGSIGVLATGTLSATTLAHLLKTMPPGTWELCCHPGYNDNALSKIRTRLLESRNTERDLLLAADMADVELIHFGALHPHRPEHI